MSEGTSVGSVFIDLIVRNTVEKQVQNIAAQAQTTATNAFSGMEKAAETMANKAAVSAAKVSQKAAEALGQGTNKTVALAQARVKELEREYERISSKLTDVNWSYSYNENGDKATDRLAERLAAQREAAYNRLISARERLAIQTQIAAEKEAAAESAASQKAVSAEEKAAGRRKSIHASMWKNMLSTAGSASKAINSKISGIIAHFAKADKSTSRFNTRLKGIVSSALLFNGLSAGLRNITSYLSTAISSTNEMKSAMANLKGAAANAASPIIQVLTPALSALANTAATALSYVSKLLTALTGKMSNAAATANKSASSAVGAARKAAASLTGFDEITKLDSNQDSGGGGGSNDAEPNYGFEGKSPFLDSVLAAVEAGQWNQVGTLLAQKLNGALASTSWPDIQEKAKQWAQNIASTINGFVTNVDWGLLASNINNGFKTALDTVTAFLTELDWQSIGNSIEEFLSGIDWSGISRSVFEAIGAALGGIGSMIWSIIEEEWNSMMDTWVANTERCGGDVVAGLLVGIVEGLVNIGQWIVENIFQPFMDGFQQAFDIHSPSGVMEQQGIFLIQGLLNGLQNTWTNITTFISNALNAIQTAFSRAWNTVLNTVVSIWNGIGSVIRGVINGIISAINGMISGIVSGINYVIGTLNQLKFTIPDWIPGYGGKTLGFNIGYATAPQIPMLAGGAVIRQPTLAMMGEYASASNNPEIVAPQSIIAETVAGVLEEFIASILSAMNNGEHIILLHEQIELLQQILEKTGVYLDGREITRVVTKYQREAARAFGG